MQVKFMGIKFPLEKITFPSLCPPCDKGKPLLALGSPALWPCRDSRVPEELGPMEQHREKGHSSERPTFLLDRNVPVVTPLASLGSKRTYTTISGKCRTSPFHHRNNINRAVRKNSPCRWQHLISSFWKLTVAAKRFVRMRSELCLALQQPLVTVPLSH